MRATVKRRLERVRRYEWDGKFPDGRKAGLKRDRRVAIGDRCLSITKASGFEVIAEEYWDEYSDLKAHVDKDNNYRYTSDQDGVGSCAAESACNTKAAMDARQNMPLVIYSPWAMYHTTSGGRDNGSVIGDNLEEARETGCFPEEVWPRSNGWRAKPSEFAYEVAQFFRLREFFFIETIKQFVSALLLGFNVHAGYSGHAVSFVRYLGNGKLWFKNSWGDWGDNGFGSLSVDKVYFGYGAYAYKDVYQYYHPNRGWGMWSGDSWITCPWKPKLDQSKLAIAARRYTEHQTARKVAGKKLLVGAAAEEAYRKELAHLKLAT